MGKWKRFVDVRSEGAPAQGCEPPGSQRKRPGLGPVGDLWANTQPSLPPLQPDGHTELVTFRDRQTHRSRDTRGQTPTTTTTKLKDRHTPSVIAGTDRRAASITSGTPSLTLGDRPTARDTRGQTHNPCDTQGQTHSPCDTRGHTRRRRRRPAAPQAESGSQVQSQRPRSNS